MVQKAKDDINFIIQKLRKIYESGDYNKLPEVIDKLVVFRQEIETHQNQMLKTSLLYHYSKEALIIINNNQITDCSPSLSRITGYDCQSLSQKSLEDITDLHYKEKLLEALKTNTTAEIEFKGRKKDNTAFFAELLLYRIPNKENQFIGILRDNTQKKLLKTQLRESEKKFRHLAETTSVGIMIYQGDYWVYANPAAEKISGYTVEEMLQMEYWTFVAPEYLKMIRERGKQRQKGEKVPSGYEFKIIAKDGREKWVYLDGKLTTYNGKPAGLISIIDITHIKNAEISIKEKNLAIEKADKQLHQTNKKLIELNEELQVQNLNLKKAKEKAEESDRLKSAFLANMSHEIRTPMNAIMGFAEILAHSKVPHESQVEFGQTIFSRSQHLLEIINDIVDISKIEANLLKIHKTNFDINKLLIELANTYKQSLLQKGKSHVDLLLKIPGNPQNPNFITTDKHRIDQILTNLISNAIKFTDQGSITIGYKNQIHDKIEFFVQDTGIGIKENEKHIIFDRFVMATNAENEKKQGTGLGLTISKSLAKLLGGEIWIEKSSSEGTSIHFTISTQGKTEVEKNIQNAKSTDQCPIKGKKILIVEDDKWSANYLETLLFEKCANITICQTAEEAIDLISDNKPFDLILMDLRLPGLSGLEATSSIKAIKPNIPIIAQTAYALNHDRTKALNAGCDDYIAKPIEAEQLIELINKHLAIKNRL